MLHRERSETDKIKSRGRPFPKGANKHPTTKNEMVAASGSKSGSERGSIENSKVKENVVNGVSSMNNFEKEKENPPIKLPLKELELIESLDFVHGLNKLSIRFSKRHNRMFRIQVFLNDSVEIRNVTYTGAKTGYGFWNLLKGAMNK